VHPVVLSRWCEPSALVGATVRGAVTPDDQRELVSYVKEAVVRFGRVGVLIRLERYAGWRHDARFDPDGLWNAGDGDGISRIAIVGEPAWKIVAPRTRQGRHVPIAYFESEPAARRWLAGYATPRQASRLTLQRAANPRAPR
jgi:hypothetical protein